MTPLICIKDLSKSFPGVNALSHVHFELMAGEVHALVAVKALHGEKLPKVIDTGFYYYNKSNIDDPKIAAVLYIAISAPAPTSAGSCSHASTIGGPPGAAERQTHRCAAAKLARGCGNRT